MAKAQSSQGKSVAPTGKDRPLSGRDVRDFSPVHKQAPGGDAGPDANSITRFRLLSMSGTRLMEGMSSYRGKGGHK